MKRSDKYFEAAKEERSNNRLQRFAGRRPYIPPPPPPPPPPQTVIMPEGEKTQVNDNMSETMSQMSKVSKISMATRIQGDQQILQDAQQLRYQFLQQLQKERLRQAYILSQDSLVKTQQQNDSLVFKLTKKQIQVQKQKSRVHASKKKIAQLQAKIQQIEDFQKEVLQAHDRLIQQAKKMKQARRQQQQNDNAMIQKKKQQLQQEKYRITQHEKAINAQKSQLQKAIQQSRMEQRNLRAAFDSQLQARVHRIYIQNQQIYQRRLFDLQSHYFQQVTSINQIAQSSLRRMQVSQQSLVQKVASHQMIINWKQDQLKQLKQHHQNQLNSLQKKMAKDLQNQLDRYQIDSHQQKRIHRQQIKQLKQQHYSYIVKLQTTSAISQRDSKQQLGKLRAELRKKKTIQLQLVSELAKKDQENYAQKKKYQAAQKGLNNEIRSIMSQVFLKQQAQQYQERAKRQKLQVRQTNFIKIVPSKKRLAIQENQKIQIDPSKKKLVIHPIDSLIVAASPKPSVDAQTDYKLSQKAIQSVVNFTYIPQQPVIIQPSEQFQSMPETKTFQNEITFHQQGNLKIVFSQVGQGSAVWIGTCITTVEGRSYYTHQSVQIPNNAFQNDFWNAYDRIKDLPFIPASMEQIAQSQIYFIKDTYKGRNYMSLRRCVNGNPTRNGFNLLYHQFMKAMVALDHS